MKEETCQSTNGAAESAGTNLKKDKNTSPSTEIESSAPSAEPYQGESSVDAPSGLWVPGGPVPTSGKLLAVPTDNKQTRWEKLKGFLSGNRVKPNPLLLNPEAKVIGTFTVYQNGHIEENVAITNDPAARAFQVLAIQITRSVFKASAQPIDKRKPSWWGEFYVNLLMDFLKEKEKAFQALNERALDVTNNKVNITSQQPQYADKKGT